MLSRELRPSISKRCSNAFFWLAPIKKVRACMRDRWSPSGKELQNSFKCILPVGVNRESKEGVHVLSRGRLRPRKGKMRLNVNFWLASTTKAKKAFMCPLVGCDHGNAKWVQMFVRLVGLDRESKENVHALSFGRLRRRKCNMRLNACFWQDFNRGIEFSVMLSLGRLRSRKRKVRSNAFLC